jgi:hypothetical protein
MEGEGRGLGLGHTHTSREGYWLETQLLENWKAWHGVEPLRLDNARRLGSLQERSISVNSFCAGYFHVVGLAAHGSHGMVRKIKELRT